MGTLFTNLKMRSQYISLLGLPKEVTTPIMSTIDRWHRECGPEWTCTRLKSIRTDFIRSCAGLDMVAPWVRRNKTTNTFSGPFKGLNTLMMSRKNVFKNILRLLNYYTTYVSPVMTEKQEKKFLDGVRAPVVDFGISRYSKKFQIAVDKLGIKRRYLPDPRPLVLRAISDVRREPHANGKNFFEGEASLECGLSFTRGTRIGWDFRATFKDIFDCVEEGLILEDHRDCDVADYPNSVGRIGFIQEPGYKLRAVANPGRVYQQALTPLGDFLFDILRGLPWDCTHNQTKGFEALQTALYNHQTVHSIDLRGATDYFPLSLQIALLEQITVPGQKYVRLFESLSRAPWRYKQGFIRWTKGQPLGLYPSFASFALTHGIILYALNNYHHGQDFFVLGDDVVILKDALALRYRAFLDEVGCPISEEKCLTSNTLCEFAGQIISSTGSYKSPKWRLPSDDSFLDFVKNIGPKAKFILRKRQRRVVERIEYIPEIFGGLNFNPQGKPLVERIFQYLQDFPDTSMSYVMGYNRLLNHHHYYNGDKFPNYRRIYIDKPDPDKESVDLILRYIPIMVKWYHILGMNLYDLEPNLNIPIEGQAGHVSRLESMERKFF